MKKKIVYLLSVVAIVIVARVIGAEVGRVVGNVAAEIDKPTPRSWNIATQYEGQTYTVMLPGAAESSEPKTTGMFKSVVEALYIGQGGAINMQEGIFDIPEQNEMDDELTRNNTINAIPEQLSSENDNVTVVEHSEKYAGGTKLNCSVLYGDTRKDHKRFYRHDCIAARQIGQEGYVYGLTMTAEEKSDEVFGNIINTFTLK